MKVDFFIVGVQKGGTTALYHYLAQKYPKIQMSLQKEIHFFDNENFNWENPDYSVLHEHFNWNVKNVVRGEATPIYIYWPNALTRIYRYNPNCKLILCLRHPTYRAYSAYRMEIGRNNETLSFEDAISEIGRARVISAPQGVHRIYSYVERGFYSKQISQMFSIFPRNNILFVRTDMLWTNLAETLYKIVQFLQINSNYSYVELRQEYIEPTHSAEIGAIPYNAMQKLNELYYSDILKTQELSGIDLSDWLHSEYYEPMRRECLSILE